MIVALDRIWGLFIHYDSWLFCLCTFYGYYDSYSVWLCNLQLSEQIWTQPSCFMKKKNVSEVYFKMFTFKNTTLYYYKIVTFNYHQYNVYKGNTEPFTKYLVDHSLLLINMNKYYQIEYCLKTFKEDQFCKHARLDSNLDIQILALCARLHFLQYLNKHHFYTLDDRRCILFTFL